MAKTFHAHFNDGSTVSPTREIEWDGNKVPDMIILEGGQCWTRGGRWLTSGDHYSYNPVSTILDLSLAD